MKLNPAMIAGKKEVDRVVGITHPDGNSQTHLLGLVNEAITDNDVIVCAAGSLPGDLHRLWRANKPKILSSGIWLFV